MDHRKYTNLSLVLCTLAAVVYNSWPLGYIVDNSTAHYGLASDLELRGHPYYWLFILGDLLTAALIISLCVILRLKLWNNRYTILLSVADIGLAVFGLFTAISALLPYGCSNVTLESCNMIKGTNIGTDAITSTVAALGLFACLTALNIVSHHFKLSDRLKLANKVVLLTWSISGIMFVIYAITNRQVHELQQLLLIFSGVALVLIGLNIYEIQTKRQLPATDV